MPIFGASAGSAVAQMGILRNEKPHFGICPSWRGAVALPAQSAAASRLCPLTCREMRSCKECGVVIDERNRVFCHSMDHGNKISGNPYIKGDCRPCHNRLGRVRHQLKKKHPAPAAGTPCTCCGAVRKLHLDHCHRTDKFRGWVCSNCNTMIGLAGESIRGLENGIRYLERSPTHSPDDPGLKTCH